MNVRPNNDRILVKRQDPEAVTAGGLHIPDTRQVKSRYGKVLAVGPGRRHKKTGERIPVGVKPGDVIYFRGTSGQELDDEGHVMLNEDELEGIVEE